MQGGLFHLISIYFKMKSNATFYGLQWVRDPGTVRGSRCFPPCASWRAGEQMARLPLRHLQGGCRRWPHPYSVDLHAVSSITVCFMRICVLKVWCVLYNNMHLFWYRIRSCYVTKSSWDKETRDKINCTRIKILFSFLFWLVFAWLTSHITVDYPSCWMTSLHYVQPSLLTVI